MICIVAELACCLALLRPLETLTPTSVPCGTSCPLRELFLLGSGDSRSLLRAGPRWGRGGAGLAGVAGLSSPTAGCVDTTECPLERELGQCVEPGEASLPPGWGPPESHCCY